MRGWLWMALLACTTAACAQKAATAGGMVTGHVVCGDTQLPARFARVSLVRRPAKAEIDRIFAPDTKDENAFSRRAATKGHETVDLLTEQSGVDGSYSIAQVPPGDYWVVAQMAGYLLPLRKPVTEEEARNLEKEFAAAPTVHVEAGRVALADVTLVRGGVITGRLRFEDGSPVVGVNVWLAPQTYHKPVDLGSGGYGALADLEWNAGTGAETDDEGRYRITAIPPGKYVVLSQFRIETGGRLLSTEGFPASTQYEFISFYYPGVFARANAKAITIRSDEAIADADITIDLSALHTLRGKVVAGEDRHTPAVIKVSASSEADPEFRHFGIQDADGNFHIDHLPPGTYTIAVTGMELKDAAVSVYMPDNVTKRYSEAKVQAMVAGEDVRLPEIVLIDSDAAKTKQ